ncbi:YwhD family protein [Bacillus niameyensis]|uniref:YwhD family protein n=1 Tax=Bacillus niameyensis TaxID=1522308 RepID=UPI0007864387|nr:YwhD family protein [Bacillus niameyensis]
MDQNKRKVEFNILKNDPVDGHKGYGVGSLSLENVTPLLIDVAEGEVWIDPQVMHARSKTERGIRYLKSLEELYAAFPKEDTKKYWVIWIVLDRKPEGPYYSGVAACELYVNRPARRGYKSMPEHVNHMDKAMKGHVIVENMDQESRQKLGAFLKEYDVQIWNRSEEEFKGAFLK